MSTPEAAAGRLRARGWTETPTGWVPPERAVAVRLRCPFCRHEWTRRKEAPRFCPRCHRRLELTGARK